MYSKKYRLEKIEEFNWHNNIYDDLEGTICYPAYFKVGERGWFLYTKDLFGVAHRVHTSEIKRVDYVDDLIIVVTKNTKFTFKLIL
jgi:hypothetical protein